MADHVQEMLDVPREFLKDGVQFINRAQKRTFVSFVHRV
jgi:protein transport protein SEC61 subunit gamma-like protein